jgi:hypothetical protein
MCFSTAPSLMISSWAIPVFERPSAISLSTCHSSRGQHREWLTTSAADQQLSNDVGVERSACSGDASASAVELRDIGGHVC